MTPFREVPRGARALILAVAVAGAGAILWRLPDVGRWTAPDFFAWIGLSVACALLEQFTVSIAHESETENYSLTDALWIPALIFARPSVLTLSVAVGVLVGHSAPGAEPSPAAGGPGARPAGHATLSPANRCRLEAVRLTSA